MNQNTHKSKLVYILALILLLTATSCGTRSASEPAALVTVEPEPTAVENIPTVVDTSKDGGTNTITSSNIENISSIDLLKTDRGSGFTWTDSGYGIALSADEFIANYSLDNMEMVQGERIIADYPYYLTTDDDGSLLGWVDSTNRVFVTDSSLSSDPLLINDILPPITGLAISSGGDFIVVATQEQTIEIRDTETGVQLDSFVTEVWLTDLSLSPDDSILAGVHSPDSTIYFIGIGTGDIIKQLIWEENISPGLTKVEFSPDWSVVAWVSGGEVQLMDVDSGELGNQLLHEGPVGSISWSVDGSMIATSSIIEQGGDYFPAINVWNGNSGEIIFSSIQESAILDLGFSPNQILFGSLDAEGMFFLWTVDR